jgi:sugar/nucleoside kinase (ribokinase family)
MMRKQDNFLRIFKRQSALAKICCEKKGKHGALLFHDLQVSAPALPLEEVFDPTGAGDTCGWFCRIYYTK